MRNKTRTLRIIYSSTDDMVLHLPEASFISPQIIENVKITPYSELPKETLKCGPAHTHKVLESET